MTVVADTNGLIAVTEITRSLGGPKTMNDVMMRVREQYPDFKFVHLTGVGIGYATPEQYDLIKKEAGIVNEQNTLKNFYLRKTEELKAAKNLAIQKVNEDFLKRESLLVEETVKEWQKAVSLEKPLEAQISEIHNFFANRRRAATKRKVK